MTAAAGPYRIRPGRPDEVETVRAIEVAAASQFRGVGLPTIAALDPAERQEVLLRAREGRLLVVADAADRPVGFVLFGEIDGTLHIEELDVHPDHARRGLGAALIERLDAIARDRGLPELTLSTFRDVPWNAPYYARLGFVPMPDEALGPGLAAIRDMIAAKGIDIIPRLFMRRPVAG
ncbi:GNAT family N-acetyltransferase [Mycobacterium sp. KBS0706]|uniref:GNAT family N-acetyltransferase n=1 Tax=Mycobacterium sp. KBS0706 TaxID=2578109 RepID=UPI00110FB245|nr:GNAT family N-acetyltransferase [Mycobacterium sp. KBS0706]TSD86291.1 GNAT family N-acetyltransferase [Mycobacterium sp. KBS0706]